MIQRSTTVHIAFFLMLACSGLPAARAQDCVLRWDPQFANPGIIGTVRTMKTYDSGDGARLYAAGRFTNVAGVTANLIASWDGAAWAPLGSGLSGSGSAEVFALAVWNGRLYAGGSNFSIGRTGGLASWNGSTWAHVGGTVSSTIFAMDGTDIDSPVGPALYAGGSFNNAGTTANVNGVAKWNGTTWSALGGGVQAIDGSVGTVFAILARGGFVYAGGAINNAFNGPGQTNPIAINHLGRWNGTTWSGLAGGMSGVPQPVVYALGVYNGDLIAGGNFTTAGGVPANYIARWNGSSWSALGSGMAGTLTTRRNVRALTVWDDGQGGGPALYAGGEFEQAGGITVNQVAKWDGTTWSALHTGMNAAVQALAPYDSGGALCAGGFFTTAGGRTSEHIAQWRCIPLLREACCFPMQGTCQDLDFNACQSAGGIDQGQGTGCADGRCTQACCNSGGFCSDRTPADCLAMGATPQGDGHACQSTECPRGCCMADNTCVDMPPSACHTPAQVICAMTPCPQACCMTDNTCLNLLASNCLSQGGVPQGAPSTCSTGNCPQACCLPDNRCTNVRATECTAQGGQPQGVSTACSTSVCPQACSLPDLTCQELLPTVCTSQGGTPLGAGSRCRDYVWACCLPDSPCEDLYITACRLRGGEPHGPNLTCPVDDCCATVTAGDFTADRRVDGRDVSGFAAAILAQPPVGTLNFCRANLSPGDVPERLDAADVTAFVSCLLTGGPCP